MRTILRSRVLPCGCTTGSYETFAAQVIDVLDAVDPSCDDLAHTPNAVLRRRPTHALTEACQPAAVPFAKSL